jgi:translation initiation factor IF-3
MAAFLMLMNLVSMQVHRKSDPPVCKIMDFHKEKYNKDVKEKERLKTKVCLQEPCLAIV